MTHLTEEDLLLLFYREHRDEGMVEAHLRECPACRAREEALLADLGMVVLEAPPRDARYGQRVWERLRPQLGAPDPAHPLPLKERPAVRRFAALLAMAAALVMAFLLGRRTSPEPPKALRAAEARRDRVLLLAVDRHLERSQVFLVELSHAGVADWAHVPARAADLVAANRLYRQAALSDGETGLASVLDELERVFVEAKNTPVLTEGKARDRSGRVEDADLLFRVRVVAAQLRERGRTMAAPGQTSPGPRLDERTGL
jgi:hypothetical protein